MRPSKPVHGSKRDGCHSRSLPTVAMSCGLCLLLGVLTLTPGTPHAYVGQSIQFAVTPTRAVHGLPVMVSGWVAPSIRRVGITVLLIPPMEGGVLTATVLLGEATRDDDGRFAWSSSPLDAAGTWKTRVEVQGIDEVAEESFEVVETTASFS